ncbi:hypothetical protein ACWET9_22830 [Streptomyces sp. NPDC004059]
MTLNREAGELDEAFDAAAASTSNRILSARRVRRPRESGRAKSAVAQVLSHRGHGLRSTLPGENRLPPGDFGLWTTGI